MGKMELKLTENISFNELTATSQGEALQEENRREALPYLQNLTKLAKELQRVRNFFGAPIRITSGFRCPALNKAVGGAETSQHTKGEAADFTLDGFADPNGLNFVFQWCRNNVDFEELVFENPNPGARPPWIHLGVCGVGRDLAKEGKKREVWTWNGKDYEAVA